MKICKNIGGFAAILLFLCLLLTGCYSDSYEVETLSALKGKSQVVFTFVTPNSSTRSASEDPDGYEDGIEYENYIDMDGGDYKIYFFSYSSGDTKGGTFIAEFEPTEITPVEGLYTTSYTLTGNVPQALMDVSNFRVVVLANWGSYPSVTVGSTTIDDLCEGTNTTYNAMVDNGVATMTSEDNLIPFFGVQEFTGVSFTTGGTTTLSPSISLLRAVAKVEIVITAESYFHELDTNGASIVNYNSTGYCAPANVYIASDYNADYSIQPESDDWPSVFVDGLHLVGGANDTPTKSLYMYKVQEYVDTDPSTGEPLETPQLETWRAYVPEYDNVSSTDDYSYITVTYGGDDPKSDNIYFAEYTNGVTDNSVLTNRYNIKRNNLYRFYVTIEPFDFRVTIDILPWVERLDNIEF